MLTRRHPGVETPSGVETPAEDGTTGHHGVGLGPAPVQWGYTIPGYFLVVSARWVPCPALMHADHGRNVDCASCLPPTNTSGLGLVVIYPLNPRFRLWQSIGDNCSIPRQALFSADTDT